MARDVIIGIDAGTSVIKSVAFSLAGEQIAIAATPNRYTTGENGAASQSLNQTWEDCASTLRALAEKVPELAARTAAIAVTGQGDGTWLVGAGNQPVTDGWLWLDARSAATARRLRSAETEANRFETTGTGLNSCQMGCQIAHMKEHHPDWLEASEAALHCKDWLYLNLTGERATDPSEAIFTFGDFRTRTYDDAVIEGLGLTEERHLLPEIVDGVAEHHPLSAEAAKATGLLAGTPVSLGYVDVTCTALGAGIYTEGAVAGVSIIGSTGMHMRATRVEDVFLNQHLTGYVMVLPIPGLVTQIQSNMAATLNIDWLLAVAADLATELGHPTDPRGLIPRIDDWIAAAGPGQLLFHPYISDAGERGPFTNNNARAGFSGLSMGHRFPDMMRAVIEGLGLAARDCYGAMGELPDEVRLTGGAARSPGLRRIFGGTVGATLRTSAREEAGAAGAAMMAAVAVGAYDTMGACIAEWVTPTLSEPEAPDPNLVELYGETYPAYLAGRQAMEPIWESMASRGASDA